MVEMRKPHLIIVSLHYSPVPNSLRYAIESLLGLHIKLNYRWFRWEEKCICVHVYVWERYSTWRCVDPPRLIKAWKLWELLWLQRAAGMSDDMYKRDAWGLKGGGLTGTNETNMHTCTDMQTRKGPCSDKLGDCRCSPHICRLWDHGIGRWWSQRWWGLFYNEPVCWY